jgi:DNA (cytosine-5)-methyltransferase 1
MIERELTAIDLFSGAGGATRGLVDSGFKMLGAVENDEIAASSYIKNHEGTAVSVSDIRKVDEGELRRELGLEPGELSLLKACPPCQGFSSLANGKIDNLRNDLVLDVARFVKEFLPSAVLLENVPGLGRDVRLTKLIQKFRALGYTSQKYVVQASDFGVPQKRKRLIVIAVKNASTKIFPEDLRTLLPDTFDLSERTAGMALDMLRNSMLVNDSLNIYRKNSAAVVARMASIPVNGTRFDLPPEHQLDCHKALASQGRRNATSSYGRVRRDAPAATMTTRCTTPSCGAFVHPTENRGLTLREAAALQTFPSTYSFEGGYGSIEKQIGNAVPVRLAEALGLAVQALLHRKALADSPVGKSPISS